MKERNKVVTKVLALCMAMMVCVTFALGGIKAKAAEQTVFQETNGTLSTQGTPYSFYNSTQRDFYMELYVENPDVSVNVVIKALVDGSTASKTITSSDWKYDSQYDLYWHTIGYKNLPVGNYTVNISSTSYYQGNFYAATGWLEGDASLSSTSLSLYAGQSKTLSVSGSTGAVTWSSSNTSVATVSAGKVTAKKAGSATITAVVDGKSLTCKVTVKKPVLSAKSCTITAGQKKTLKVTKKSGKVTWKSSKKSVATVSSKGVVKAKKAGTAKITASVDGCKLTCKVKVKKNQYTRSSVSNSQAAQAGEIVTVVFNPTKISYNSKGQLVCKIQIINNSLRRVEGLKNLKITVKAKNGSTIASYTLSKKSIVIPSKTNKTITITIPKSKVKKQNADLRTSTPNCSGLYTYRIW